MLENIDEIQQLQSEIKNLKDELRLKEQRLFQLQFENVSASKS